MATRMTARQIEDWKVQMNGLNEDPAQFERAPFEATCEKRPQNDEMEPCTQCGGAWPFGLPFCGNCGLSAKQDFFNRRAQR